MGSIMKNIYPVVLVMILLGLLAPTASAQGELQFPVEQFTLDNGLTFMVVERHTAPVFTGFICVGAGSANERIGDIGTAHLFEHMMFKGSPMVRPVVRPVLSA